LNPGSKNLQAQTALKELERTSTMEAGANKPDVATMKGLLLQFTFYLHKEGYAKDSRYVDCIRMLKNSNANLLDPENVKEIIANKKWKPGVKMQAVYAYDAMTKMLNITWKKPRYRQEETLPFVPIEKELDQLIAGCKGRKLVAFLQTLKETFADPGEAIKLRWKDIRENVITINHPVRGHNPRRLKVSHKLIAMIKALPKTSPYIFNTTYASLGQCFRRVRKRTSNVLQNPRIKEITFTSFRHWGATMIYHQTKSILLVKKLLGHKHIKNTEKYTHLIEFEGDDYDVATATTLEEAKKIITAGFEYVTELKGVKLFRKPRRFNA